MVIQREPFTATRLQEERDKESHRVLSVRLNAQELRELEEDASILHQERPATALKQLARLGRLYLHSPETVALIRVVFNNKRRNWRQGIGIAQPNFKRK